MFEMPVEPVRIKSRSPQAYDFWKNHYKPTMDDINAHINSIPMTFGIWSPYLPKTIRFQIQEIQVDLNELNISTRSWVGSSNGHPPDHETALAALSDFCSVKKNGDGAIETQPNRLIGSSAWLTFGKNNDNHTEHIDNSSGDLPEIVFGILLGRNFDLTRFLDISPETSSRLFLFVDASIEDNYRENDPDFKFRNIYPKSMTIRYPDDFQDRSFYQLFLSAVDALRFTKYLRLLLPGSGKGNMSKRNIFSLYEQYKPLIDTFRSRDLSYLISFLRFMPNPSQETILKHLKVETKSNDKLIEISENKNIGTQEVDEIIRHFEKIGLINVDENGQLKTAYEGEQYFKSIGADSMPILENEKSRFIERWRYALEKTYYTHFKLFRNTQQLAHLSDAFYFSTYRRSAFLRWFRYFVNRTLFEWKTREEIQFLSHPWAKQLFYIWRDNISGVRRRDWRVSAREEMDFLKYMFHKFTITHHPKHSARIDNYNKLTYNLTYTHSNSHAHFYLFSSFLERPVKGMIRQYFDLAAITGRYDLLFRRFPPYHCMLKLHARPGELTSFDQRHNMDRKPLTIKLDTIFTIPVKLDEVQTRQRDKTISIPVEYDEDAENQKTIEIESLQQKIADLPKNFLNNYVFGGDGKIYSKDGDDRTAIDGFMAKRSLLVHTIDELNLLKAMPRPGTRSGLVIRFKLLDPIAVLINGINGNRDFNLKEIRCLAKCLDLLSKKESDKKLNSVIDTAFDSPQSGHFSEETLDLLNKLDQIEKSKESDDKAWSYLTAKFIQGDYHLLLETISHRLMKDGFEILFNLFPLLKGIELDMEDAGNVGEQKIEMWEKQIPLIENLRLEMSNLLKNIFSRHIDISGPTIMIQSEARLSQMIIAHCLNVNSSADAFKTRIEEHLVKHYKTHSRFLAEYNNNLDFDFHEIIRADADAIIQLIQTTRTRLFSRTNNNRLLCFIDPTSVEVQIGNFEYGGADIDNELSYIRTKKTEQLEIALKQCISDTEIRVREMEKDTAIGKLRLEREQTEAQMENIKRVSELKEKIHILKLRQLASEAHYLSAEALKNQDIKTYVILSLLDAHRRGGIEDVENLLKDSPNLLFAVDPKVAEICSLHKLKDKIIDKLDPTLQNVDPIALTTLLNKDIDEQILPETYKSTIEEIVKYFKNFSQTKWPIKAQKSNKTSSQKVSTAQLPQNVKTHTKIQFPEKCKINCKVKLMIQLTLESLKDTHVRQYTDNSSTPYKESIKKNEVKLAAFVSSENFEISEPWKCMSVPFYGDSEEIAFEMSGTEVGQQIIELEFFYGSARIGYTVIGTEVVVDETTGLDDQVSYEPITFSNISQPDFTITVSRHKGSKLEYWIRSKDSLHQFDGGEKKFEETDQAIFEYWSELSKEMGEYAKYDFADENRLRSLWRNIQGWGTDLSDRCLSDELKLLFNVIPTGSVVCFSTNERWIPWELIFNGTHFLGQKFFLYRTPKIPIPKSFPTLDQPIQRSFSDAPCSIANVIGGDLKPQKIVEQIKSMFNDCFPPPTVTTYEKINLNDFFDRVVQAQVIHLTCHGHTEPRLSLQLGDSNSPLNSLTHINLKNIPELDDRILFANACSSASASLFVSEFQNFGWEFYKKGVAAFIGTLSLVPTAHAVAFAERFYEKLLKGASIGESLHYAKSMADHRNPFWLFYTLYGDPFIHKFGKISSNMEGAEDDV